VLVLGAALIMESRHLGGSPGQEPVNGTP